MKMRTLTLLPLATVIAGCVAAEAGPPPAAEAGPESAEPATESAGSATKSANSTATTQAADGFEWFWAINGPVSGDAGSDLSVDADGNVFLAGSHGGLDMDRDGVVDFQSGGTAYEGAHNSFFMKLNRGPSDDRVRLRWMRTPHTPADRSQSRVAADGRSGVYVIGAFAESLSFEDGPTLPGAGGNDAFVARYDGEGSVIWARVFGGPGSDGIYGVASDRDANAYVVGVGSGSFPLDEHGAEFRASGERASILVSYGPEGAVRWTHIFGSGVPLAFGVKVAPSGEVYVTGELEGAADFDQDGAVDLPAPSDRDGFVARFDPDGTFLGAWVIPLPAYPAFARNGDVVLGSGMGGPLEERYGHPDFDGDGRPDLELLDGRIAVSGHYKGIRDLDEDGVEERVDHTVDPSLEWELAILILSAEDGQVERVWTAPGPGNDWAHAVAFLPNEPALIVTGAIQLTADFTGDGRDGEGWAVCENLGDIFFAQYRLGETKEVKEEVVEDVVEPRATTLSVSLREVSGVGLYADLIWSGAGSARVDVYRNDSLVTTTDNDGEYTDEIPRGTGGPFHYRVCDAGTSTCSSAVQARF